MALCAAALLAAGGACAAGGCGRSDAGRPHSAAPEPVPVVLAPVVRQAVDRTIGITGTLYGVEEATISSKIPGRVAAIRHDVGDAVAPGAPLAELERDEYELELEQRRTAMLQVLARLGLDELPDEDFDPAQVPTVVRARLEAANAEARHRRAEQLLDHQPPLISEQDYGDIKTAWEVARSDADVALLTARALLAEARSRSADLALARQRLQDATVRAPRPQEAPASTGEGASEEGVRTEDDPPLRYAVAARLVSVGEYLREGTPMFRLVASDPIEFRGEIPERYAGDVRLGQRGLLHVASSPTPFEGIVSRISPHVSPQSRTLGVEITLHNPDGVLKPGSFGRAQVVTGTSEDVPFVPEEALIVFAGVAKVFSVEDGKAVEHRVEPGQHRQEGSQRLVEVVGLPDHVREVVVEGAARLANGLPVEVTSTGRS